MASPEAQGALLRWRLVLGPEAPAGEGARGAGIWEEAQAAVAADPTLSGIDRALDFLYAEERSAGLGGSMPYVPTWLGDIRRYFPREVVAFMEKDAIERRGLKQLLLEPDTLETLEKDVSLVATILAFKHLMPDQTRQTACRVVAEIVTELRRRLEHQIRQTVLGALRRDRHSPLKVARNLDFRRTVREGLRHYRPELGKIVPERVYFYANQRRFHEWRVIILVDQSGSMGESVVYASIVAAVFASLPTLDTRLVFFDTSVADVSDQLSDPIEVLFGVQLGGGTDIARAVQYGASLVAQPDKTLFLLVTDLYEGGDASALLQQLAALKESRVQVLCVLALNDAGKASFDDVDRLLGHAPDAVPELRRRLVERLQVPFGPGEVAVLYRPTALMGQAKAVGALDGEGRFLALHWPDSWSRDLPSLLPEPGGYALFGLLELTNQGMQLRCLSVVSGGLRWGRGPLYPDRS